jgi:two-component system chemotaxis sensor kinase CheA
LALDMAKYQKLFLEEATEHLSEISHALLELEKDTSGADSIDTIFRMAHSIKSMAASLGYDAVAELAHALEDRMETIRSAGRVSSAGELSLLFRGLEGLERMVGVVRETGEPPAADAALLSALGEPTPTEPDAGAAPPGSAESVSTQATPDVGPEGSVPPSVAGAGAADSKKKGLI